MSRTISGGACAFKRVYLSVLHQGTVRYMNRYAQQTTVCCSKEKESQEALTSSCPSTTQCSSEQQDFLERISSQPEVVDLAMVSIPQPSTECVNE